MQEFEKDGEFPIYWQPWDPTQSPTSSYGLEYLFQNRIVTKFRIICTDTNHRTRTMSGFVKQLNETYPVAGLVTKAVILRITSAPTEVTTVISTTPASETPVAAGGAATATRYIGIAGGATSTSAGPAYAA